MSLIKPTSSIKSINMSIGNPDQYSLNQDQKQDQPSDLRLGSEKDCILTTKPTNN